MIGVLFLLVSNNLWLGWANVWPLFPILAGMVFLRVYARSKTPEMLFGGVATVLMGVFLLLFSLNIFPWSRMDSLWPVIPAIASVALLSVAAAHFHRTGSLVTGVVFILFALLGLLHETGAINQRVISPFVRLWPLVLIVAGATLLRAKPAGVDADMRAVREAMGPAEGATGPAQAAGGRPDEAGVRPAPPPASDADPPRGDPSTP